MGFGVQFPPLFGLGNPPNTSASPLKQGGSNFFLQPPSIAAHTSTNNNNLQGEAFKGMPAAFNHEQPRYNRDGSLEGARLNFSC